jgi:hypothetical protein
MLMICSFGCRKFRHAVVKVHELLQNPPLESPCIVSETLPSPDAVRSELVPTLLADVTLSQPPPVSQPKEPIPSILQVPTPLHLLIVDDNEINLKVCRSFNLYLMWY